LDLLQQAHSSRVTLRLRLFTALQRERQSAVLLAQSIAERPVSAYFQDRALALRGQESRLALVHQDLV
jgi:hypothetical protein